MNTMDSSEIVYILMKIALVLKRLNSEFIFFSLVPSLLAVVPLIGHCMAPIDSQSLILIVLIFLSNPNFNGNFSGLSSFCCK